MSDIQGLDLEDHITRAIDLRGDALYLIEQILIDHDAAAYVQRHKEISECNHRIEQLETAMETFIDNVGKAKNKTELLLAGVVANTRFKELLEGGK